MTMFLAINTWISYVIMISNALELLIFVLIVGKKAKKRISKRVFPESKARQIFRKTNISYSLIRTSTCAYQACVYQGVRNVHFSENLACFVFLKHPFWDSPFCLTTDVILFFLRFHLWDIFQENAFYKAYYYSIERIIIVC